MGQLPYLTADLPGVGGSVKRHRADFEVEEVPLYNPCGTGTHVYFGVEKTGLTTNRAVQRIAAALEVAPRGVGYAGLKDAQAVTRQVLSVEHVDPEAVRRLDLPGLRILWVDRHTNKLKLGHLAGNRFTVRIRDARLGSPEPVEALLAVLHRRGLPNYFGAQRFGQRGDNAAIGLAALGGDYDDALAVMLGRPAEDDLPDLRAAREQFDRGDYRAAAEAWPRSYDAERRVCRSLAAGNESAERAWRALDWPARRLYLSALQSKLFNCVVARRIDSLGTLLSGDLAMKHVNGAVFSVTDAAAEQPRCDAFEISPSGPMFGRKMKPAAGDAAAIECAVLAEAGLSPDTFSQARGERLDGSRRALRVRPEHIAADTGADEHGAFVRLRFDLPPGSYATTLLREVCKNDPP